MLSSRFRDFSLDEERKKALNPLMGKGIFSSDGAQWAHSRALLRPQFTKAQLVDLTTLEKHVTRLANLIPEDEDVDLQKLVFVFTMDEATEFLFGESTEGLLQADKDGAAYNSRMAGFAESIQYAQDKMAMHLALGWWANLKPDPKFKKDVAVVHGFVDEFVQKALKQHSESKKRPEDEENEGPYVFLKALVQDEQNPVRIRDELVNILIAGRDTTASLISNIFMLLSQHPAVWENLKREVSVLQGRPPRFEEIPTFKSVRYTINECKLYVN